MVRRPAPATETASAEGSAAAVLSHGVPGEVASAGTGADDSADPGPRRAGDCGDICEASEENMTKQAEASSSGSVPARLVELLEEFAALAAERKGWRYYTPSTRRREIDEFIQRADRLVRAGSGIEACSDCGGSGSLSDMSCCPTCGGGGKVPGRLVRAAVQSRDDEVCTCADPRPLVPGAKCRRCHKWTVVVLDPGVRAAVPSPLELRTERCEGRYPVPQTSPPREEPFDVTYRCALPQGHDGPHGSGSAVPSPPEGRPMRVSK
jgi:hypothetical protein